MMKQIHSYWAYLAVLLLLLTVVNAIIGLTQNKEFKEKDLRISLFTLIVMHIQLLIGLGWYFMSPWYKALKEVGMGEAMKDAPLRLQTIEHPLMMILAIVLITMGWSKHKKQTADKGKFKTIAIFYGLGLLFVLSRIPWGQWLG
jgi:NADH:ubiquinone oxidoreductase subunit 2 (subunit N)